MARLTARFTPQVIQRAVLLALGMAALFTVRGRLLELVAAIGRVGDIGLAWLAVMAVLQLASVTMAFALTKSVLPGLNWFDAATTQAISSAVSRVVPAGAVLGTASLYRSLARTGIEPHQAAGTLAATGLISNLILFTIPTAALILVLLGTQLPPILVLASTVGTVLFAVQASVTGSMLWCPNLLRYALRTAVFLVRPFSRLLKIRWTPSETRLIEEQDRLRAVIGHHRGPVLLTATANWLLEYLVLLTALLALGADPHPGLVLLVFAATSTLGMVPLTPGGLGIAEVGLYTLLVAIGIDPITAGTATISYRLISWWLPLLAGPLAWVAFNRRNPPSASPRFLRWVVPARPGPHHPSGSSLPGSSAYTTSETPAATVAGAQSRLQSR